MSYTVPMCDVCRGRGEVASGITGGVREYGPTYEAFDWRGNKYPARAAFPTVVVPNPNALIVDRRTGKKEIWHLDINPLCELWSLAICGLCRGSGMA